MLALVHIHDTTPLIRSSLALAHTHNGFEVHLHMTLIHDATLLDAHLHFQTDMMLGYLKFSCIFAHTVMTC